MAKKPRAETFFTPVGTLGAYAWINRPDENFNDRGIYHFTVAFNGDDPKVVDLVERIETAHKENFEAQLADFEENPPAPKKVRGKLQEPEPPTEGQLPFYTDEETGMIVFTFKKYASYIDKDTKERKELPLRVVDSKGKRIEDVPNCGAGSQVKVRFSLVPYKSNDTVGAGVKLQLESVMIVILEEWSGDGGWGDEAVEDGYVAPEKPKDKPKGKPQDEAEDAPEDKDGDF